MRSLLLPLTLLRPACDRAGQSLTDIFLINDAQTTTVYNCKYCERQAEDASVHNRVLWIRKSWERGHAFQVKYKQWNCSNLCWSLPNEKERINRCLEWVHYGCCMRLPGELGTPHATVVERREKAPKILFPKFVAAISRYCFSVCIVLCSLSLLYVIACRVVSDIDGCLDLMGDYIHSKWVVNTSVEQLPSLLTDNRPNKIRRSIRHTLNFVTIKVEIFWSMKYSRHGVIVVKLNS